MEHYEMPVGLGMALAMHPQAMERFSALPDSRKREIIEGTHTISSREEMRRYVEQIIA